MAWHKLASVVGETYIDLSPDVVGADGTVAEDTVRTFLKDFIDRFAGFCAHFAPAAGAAA